MQQRPRGRYLLTTNEDLAQEAARLAFAIRGEEAALAL